MSRRLDRPAKACTLAVSLAALGAAVLPATAHADANPEQPPTAVAALTDAVSAAAVDAVPTLDTAAAATADATTPVDVPTTPTDDLSSPAGAPVAASDPTAAATPDADGAATQTSETPDASPLPASDDSVSPEAPTTPAPASTNGSEAQPESTPLTDTTQSTPDIGPDTPVGTGTPPAKSPAAQGAAPQASVPAPANINVSVRIGSPGDNGAVSQVNVAVSTPAPAPAQDSHAATSLPVAPTPDSAHQASDDGGASGAVPAGGTASGTASSGTGGQAPSAGPDTWYWSWDCLGDAPIAAISPTASGANSLPSSWTWIWNCGGNSSQYQGGTPSGYQPSNTNISIRIASPGNDGPVTQMNQVIATQVSQVRAQIEQVVAQTASTVIGAAPVTGMTLPHLDPVVPLPVISLPPVAKALGGMLGISVPGTTEAAAGITISLPGFTTAPMVSIPSSFTPAPAAQVAAPAATTRPLRRDRAGSPTAADPRRTPLSRNAGPSGAAMLRSSPPHWPTESSWRSTPTQAASVERDDDSRVGGTAPRRPTPSRDPSAPTPISSVSAAAVGGGGSPGPGLPFLLAIPIVAALLDLARRVALQRGTWPSGHRRRAPERPG
jgi:hypothetical protein